MADSSNGTIESLLRALVEIAEDQKTLLGHGDYIEGPMSGEDAQNIARRALEEIERLKGERDAMSYVALAVVDQMERLAKEEAGQLVMTAPTQGPWGIEKSTDLWWVGLVGTDGKVDDIVATFSVGQAYSQSYRDRNKANANLIAAAPDILEALHLVGMSAGWQYLTMETRSVIEAAIAKAEGRS